MAFWGLFSGYSAWIRDDKAARGRQPARVRKVECSPEEKKKYVDQLQSLAREQELKTWEPRKEA
jgi:hypothetical protein